MKILITGAHFTPAVAVIEELKKYPGTTVVYAGRAETLEGDSSKSVESQVLPAMGVKFIPIVTGRLQRSFTLYTIPSLLKIPVGLIQALAILLSEKPDVILSFGGYVAVPVVITGWLFSIPVIVHEQTLVWGFANRISSFFASRIALSFKQAGRPLKGKNIIVTGNPVRQMIFKKISGELKRKKPQILVTGGNQGSHIINQTVEGILEKLTPVASIIHITGDNKFKDYERLKNLQSSSYRVEKWIGDDYGAVLREADLVVCRGGINTLTELAALGKPALVIPIPYLYQDEQNINARFFKAFGLARILPQREISGDSLFKNIKRMLNDLGNLTEKAKKARETVVEDAAKRLAQETIMLANK